MKINELNHVAIPVSDLARSVEFYQHVLRLPPMSRPAFDFPGAWFRLGSQQELHLIGRSGEKVISGTRSHHFALAVEDIAAWEQHLKSTGTEFLPPKQRPDGVWQIFLKDPDGHYIELCQPPG